jgi:hypothetical protein
MTAANEIVNLGLKDLGYEYVNSEATSIPMMVCVLIPCYS